MTQYAKLLPEELPSWQLPYWEALKEHRLIVQKCAQCATLRHIPKEICARCHSTDYQWSELSGNGEIFTYTIVRRAPTPAYQADVPYVIAHVAMNEGVRMIANLVDLNPDDVTIGQPVRAIYDDVTPDWTLLRFEPR